jgi:hypothetical protein
MSSYSVFLVDKFSALLVLFCINPFLLAVTIILASVYVFVYLLTKALLCIYSSFGYTALESTSINLFLYMGAVLAFDVF